MSKIQDTVVMIFFTADKNLEVPFTWEEFCALYINFSIQVKVRVISVKLFQLSYDRLVYKWDNHWQI